MHKKHIQNIGIFGLFDLNSYGDLLFPCIAHTELTARLGEIHLYPFSYHPKTSDGVAYTVHSLAELSEHVPILDGVLIGGGDIIRFDTSTANHYSPPTEIWLYPALLALQCGIPIAWNAPSALEKTPTWAQEIMVSVLKESDYFSVRDIKTKEQLLSSFPDQENNITLSPDTIFGIERTFPQDAKQSNLLSTLLKKWRITKPYILLQPTHGIESFLALFQQYPAHFEHYQIVALPISTSDDFALIPPHLPNVTYISTQPTLACTTALIANARFAVGSSLYLGIVTAAYHVPCFCPITANSRHTPLENYTHIFYFDNAYPYSISATWVEACINTFDPANNQPLLQKTTQELDTHWDRIAQLFTAPQRDPIARPRLVHFLQYLPALLEKNSIQQETWSAMQQKFAATNQELTIAKEAQQELETIKQSTSWRIIQRLNILFAEHPAFRKVIHSMLQYAWQALSFIRRRYKNIAGNLISLFSHTSKEHDVPKTPAALELNTQDISAPLKDTPYISQSDASYQPIPQDIPSLHPPIAPTHISVRTIAFYLPQFHPIPENDAWWGKGFTEWRNVLRGTPQFDGHYQPHLPGELGLYDLRLPEIQQRQIALAKSAGLAGFCFYFYWFSGTRLLEKPTLQYLEHTELDFPFCLCWANENWSRRWDGKDQELLMSQAHSEEDDIAFISYIAKYLADPRYIKINGKPLLLVYRPSLLPNAKATSARWRAWAQTHGIGDIFLAYTQSFESVDPALYGFDAAIEFPPNNTPVPTISNQTLETNKHFEGYLYDARYFVEQSRQYTTPSYKLFRGTFPSWDNTARKRNKGHILLNTSPENFEEWLHNAAIDTMRRFSAPSEERLLFINAWNEWAEGAHLEPDEKYGYAWLHATRNALHNASLNE